jgi:pimeloyl-ACP methyl ester carboxylesterase
MGALPAAVAGLAAGAAVAFAGSAVARAQGATPEAAAVAPPQALLPAQRAERTGQTVTINGAEIYYEQHGDEDGMPVLLLNGGLGHAGYFVNQIAPLVDAGYRPIVMDSRGHGRSTFDEQPISYDLMAADVVALLDHLGVERADVVGWSDGGIIGLELAIEQPERVNRIVAYGANADPSGVRADIGENAYFNAYVAAAAADYQAIAPQPERWQEFLANISNMWATEPNYTAEQLATITTPILILQGEDEEAIDTDHARMMAEAIPTAELVLMPGTGHFAMFEQP